MEVESIGNTQIIHMEETGITQPTIGLMYNLQKAIRKSSDSPFCLNEFTAIKKDLLDPCFNKPIRG